MSTAGKLYATITVTVSAGKYEDPDAVEQRAVIYTQTDWPNHAVIRQARAIIEPMIREALHRRNAKLEAAQAEAQ